MLALLTGDKGSGTPGGSGGGHHQHLQRPQPYLVVHSALLHLPRSLLRLDIGLDLVLKWVQLALISNSDQTSCQWVLHPVSCTLLGRG